MARRRSNRGSEPRLENNCFLISDGPLPFKPGWHQKRWFLKSLFSGRTGYVKYDYPTERTLSLSNQDKGG